MNFLDELIDAVCASELVGDELVASVRQLIQANQDGDTPADLAELEQAAVAAFQQRYNDGEYDPVDAPVLIGLDAVTGAVRAELAEQQTQQDALDAQLQGLADRVLSPDAEGDDDSGDDDQVDPDDDPDDDQVDGTGSDGDDAPTAPPAESALQPASRRRAPMTSRATQQHRLDRNGGRKRTGAPATGGRGALRRMSITAAADVPNTPTGSSLTLRQLAEASIRKFGQMPIGTKNAYVRSSLAVVRRETDASLVASGGRDDVELVDRIANERNLPGGSLLAAHRRAVTAAASTGTFTYGGMWCAPSETDYTLCPQLATESGMLDLPTMTVTHGGLRYPVTNEYPDLGYDQYFREYDENHVFDPEDPDSLKPCISGFCPEWDEVRLKARPLCIMGDILKDRAWPELVERFMSDVMIKNAHWMNANYLAYIASRSDQVASFSAQTGQFGIGSASFAIADRIGLLVTWFRNLYRMDPGATLEGVAPMWLLDLLKADIAKRSNRNSTAVSTAEVDQVFTERGARMQWVYDWQSDALGAAKVSVPNPDAGQPGQPATLQRWMPPATWPTSATLMFYPAGSWVLGQQDIITLDAVYDSTNLRQNIFTRLFTEDAYLLLNRCGRSFKITVTDLCANGALGPFRDACPPALPAVPGATEDAPLFTSEVAAATP
jgi:hypothetical protein